MNMLKRIGRLIKGRLTNDDWQSSFGKEDVLQSGELPQTEKRRWALKVLEVAEGASMADIRKAYLRLSRRYHPDNFSGQSEKVEMANQLMSKINNAYELLTS